MQTNSNYTEQGIVAMPLNFTKVLRIEEKLLKKYDKGESEFPVLKVKNFTGIILSKNLACFTQFDDESRVATLCLGHPAMAKDFNTPAVAILTAAEGMSFDFEYPEKAHPELVSACKIILDYIAV